MTAAPVLPPGQTWRRLLEIALTEDVGPGDATTPLVVEADREGHAVIEAREPLVVCGLEIAAEVFRAVDPALRFASRVSDGDRVESGTILADVAGPLRGLLMGERTALNCLGRLCGVASTARRFVDAVAGTQARIVDTRKTLPGWRTLDKYAAAVGGALNHRLGLYDGILLKDNHVALAGSVELAVKSALASAPAALRVQVEVESESDALAAVDAGAEFLLLDNCPLAVIRRIVAQLGERALLEVSGGVKLENVRDYAETGVARISIGALTHSAPAADVALEIATPGGVEA
jgi:nicotinate-nucleotide pyrophosphorylase (carboxylating)